MGPMVGFKRKMISRNVGYAWKVDNSKSKKAFWVRYRPLQESIVDFFQQMIDQGIVGPKQ
jgi:dihydroflavonol-4-reductase